MSRLQDQEGRRIRPPGHGISVTDVKPPGLMAIRPATGPVQKAKEGAYQNKKGAGCISISSVMVKAIKSALMEAAECKGPVDCKRKTCSPGSKGRPQPKNAVHTKCNNTSANGAPNKKSTSVPSQNINRKKVTGLMNKLELISRMNMEGVIGPKSTPAMELTTTKKGRPETPPQKASQKRKPEVSPTRATRSPTRKVQKDNSKRKSMVSVPAGWPDCKTPGPKKPANQLQTSVKTAIQFPGSESRNRLSTLSLDRLPLAKTNTRPHKQRIEPDMTTYDFMRKLMSYSTTSFRDLRNERRSVRTPTLDSIPEES